MAFPVGENALIKEFALSYVPGTLGQAAHPGQPFVAPYCVNGVTTYEAYDIPPSYTFMAAPRLPDGTYFLGIPLPAGAVPVLAPDPARPAFQVTIGWMVPVAGSGGRGVREVFTPGVVCYPGQAFQPPTPAIAPTPSAIATDFQLGWNSGARSIPMLLNSGRAEFKAPWGITGCVAGLNDADTGQGYVEIEHAWYVSKGKAKVFESGAQAYNHGAYADGDLFAVERIGSTITYKVNGSVVYTSAVPSAGVAVLDASLFRGEDYIYSPAIVEYETVESVCAPCRSRSSDVSSVVAAVAEPCTSSSGVYFGAAVSMRPCLSNCSDYVYGQAAVSMLPCQSFASGGLLVPDFSVVAVGMATCMSIAQETSLIVGDGVTAVMLPCESLAYADVEFVLSECLPCTNVAYERTRVDMDHDAMISILDLWYQPAEKIAIVSSDMSIAIVLSWDVFIESLLDSAVTVTTGLSTIGDAALLIDTIIQLGFGVPVLSSDNQVWVVNEAGQTTRYEGYPFNSFCQIGSQYYGAREDGIYLLEGDTDAGSPIRASINLGKVDFGTTLMKHVTNCYIGVASDDRMYLKVISNGQEYIYSARSSSDQMQTQRFDIGRGLRSNFMIFELLNKDGCDFELGSIEFIAIPSTSRRI